MYKPLPFRDGNKIVNTYTEEFDDKAGHKATITKVDYRDKRKKLVEGFVLFVKWHT